MVHKLKLSKACKEDIPLLAEFLGELFAIERDFTPDCARQASALAILIENPAHATVYAITLEGRIIGMVVLHRAISTAEGGWRDSFVRAGICRRRIVG